MLLLHEQGPEPNSTVMASKTQRDNFVTMLNNDGDVESSFPAFQTVAQGEDNTSNMKENPFNFASGASSCQHCPCLPSDFISWGCHSKGPHTRWLKSTAIYVFTALGARSLTRKYPQGHASFEILSRLLPDFSQILVVLVNFSIRDHSATLL